MEKSACKNGKVYLPFRNKGYILVGDVIEQTEFRRFWKEIKTTNQKISNSIKPPDMEDLKNDSVLCLRLMIVLSVMFMVCLSKIGAYIFGLIILGLNCWFYSAFCNIPFLRNFMFTTILGSVVFEICYQIFFTSSKSYFMESKRIFEGARMELKSRKAK